MKFLTLSLFTCLIFGCAARKNSSTPQVIAYYTGNAETLQQYPLEKLTQVIYSFLHLQGNVLAFDNEASKAELLKIAALKQKFPRLKILLSIGGWGGCKTCSPVFSNAANRKTFAASVLKILEQTNTDGLDIDWEYPAIEGYPQHPYSPADKQNFTELVRELRSVFGKKYQLSFAAGGFSKFLEESIDWKAVMPLVDRVNLMTYDLISGYSTATGHHTALYSNSNQKESTDNCVQTLLRYGVPAHKMVIGAAFYARLWKDVDSVNNGLYRSGKFETMVPYHSFNKKFSTDSGYVKYWDNTTKASYYYNSRTGRFATFDDARSLSEKVKFMKQHKLGGIMFWELRNDSKSDGLLHAIDSSLRQ